MSTELAYYLLEQLKKQGMDEVILSVSDSQNLLIKFANNKVATTKSWESKNIGIFTTKNQRILSTTLKSFDDKSAKELSEKISKVILKLPKNEDYDSIAKGPFKYKEVSETYDPKLEDFDEEMIDYVKQSIDTIKKTAKRCAGTFEKNISDHTLITSNNIKAHEKCSSLYFSIRSFVDKESSGASTCVSRVKNKLNFLESAKKSASIAKQAMLPKKAISGKFDVIFEPLAFASVVENIGECSSIFSVESGTSCLKNKLNKKIVNDKITIYDDPLIQNGYNSSSFDMEGYPTEKKAIIENGILKNYLHNTSTAKRYKTKTTGNAGLISPEPINLYLKEGISTKEEMFKTIKKGIYITNVWYTRFQNYQTGDFSTIPRDGAFYIENGKIKYALKGIRITENLLNVLNNVSMLGNKVEQIKSWEVNTPTFLPYVLVKDVNITKPE